MLRGKATNRFLTQCHRLELVVSDDAGVAPQLAQVLQEAAGSHCGGAGVCAQELLHHLSQGGEWGPEMLEGDSGTG